MPTHTTAHAHHATAHAHHATAHTTHATAHTRHAAAHTTHAAAHAAATAAAATHTHRDVVGTAVVQRQHQGWRRHENDAPVIGYELCDSRDARDGRKGRASWSAAVLTAR